MKRFIREARRAGPRRTWWAFVAIWWENREDYHYVQFKRARDRKMEAGKKAAG